MSLPLPLLCSAKDGQQSIDGPELSRDVYSISRDLNVNNGTGPLTINNYNSGQSTYRHIRGTEEEEAEYGEASRGVVLSCYAARLPGWFLQYLEYKRGELRLSKLIHRDENFRTYDWETGRRVECVRSLFLAEVLCGDRKGTIVTVESFEGTGAPIVSTFGASWASFGFLTIGRQRWKQGFVCYSGRSLSENNAHLHALNRSKIPLLIFSGGLIPFANLEINAGFLGHVYIEILLRHPQLDSGPDSYGGTSLRDLWVDPARGVICLGPWGPDTDFKFNEDYSDLDEDHLVTDQNDLPLTADLLQVDVFLRFLASQKIDDAFLEAAYWGYRSKRFEWIGSCNQPTIISFLTQTPIATANNIWTVDRDGDPAAPAIDRNVLENGLNRFQLERLEGLFQDGGSICLSWNLDIDRAWLSQAPSVFHSCGLSLEDDLSDYEIVVPDATLIGYLDQSPSKSQRRRQQTIYLFVHSLPHFWFPTKYKSRRTSLLHFWSFHEDGHSRLTPGSCHDLGLPLQLELYIGGHNYLYSWTTEHYKSIHRYQLARGFDPTTTDFARHLGYVNIFFKPTNDEDRFKEVHEEPKCPNGLIGPNMNADSERLSNTPDKQPAKGANFRGDLQVQGTHYDREKGLTLTGASADDVANDQQRVDTEFGGTESRSYPEQVRY
ncbi:hypothetical protein PM082_006178 [Marasmius tenuissimus]|nr:hypothetical protein PM082_006178 [Marasmius tenuissimus]